MANGRDTLRIVTLTTGGASSGVLSVGGRPVQVLDLNDATGYWRDRDAGFTFTPAAVTQQVSRRTQRFGGGRVVGETHDNGSIGWTAYIRGSTVVEASQRIEALLSQIHETARGRYIEWAPDGLTSSFLELAGPGSWTPVYDPLMLSQSQAMRVQIGFPILPLIRWAQMSIGDDFTVNSSADYTFDASTTADVAIAGGVITPVVGAALTAERRARHTIRGYKTLGGQVTVSAVPGPTITGHKAGGLLRATNFTNYIEIYIDDNGTNSRLRIDAVVGGTRTNMATTNLASRISNGSRFWVRGRIVDGTVVAEHFTSTPTPMGTPTTTVTWNGTGAVLLSSFGAGYTGWSWVPQHASAAFHDLVFEPYTYTNQTLPAVIATADDIPGTAPALADVRVTPSGGSNPPIWALVNWTRIDSGAVNPPYGIFEAEGMVLTGWAASGQAGARGGNDVRATTSGAGSYLATKQFNAGIQALEPDAFTDNQLDIEIWARALISSTNVNPRLVPSVAVVNGAGVIGTRYTIENGAAGKLLTKPSSGTVYRYTRLGIISLDGATTGIHQISIAGTVDAGSGGVFGFDYVKLLPARRRALGPTGVAASTLSPFVPSTSEWIKRLRSDLSATLESNAIGVTRDVGLGGAIIQPSPGPNQWIVKLSNLVPDDPTSDTTTEQLAHNATVSIDVTPRSYLLRGT